MEGVWHSELYRALQRVILVKETPELRIHPEKPAQGCIAG